MQCNQGQNVQSTNLRTHLMHIGRTRMGMGVGSQRLQPSPPPESAFSKQIRIFHVVNSCEATNKMCVFFCICCQNFA